MTLSLSVGCRNGLANTQGFKELFHGGTFKIFTGESPGVEYGATGTEIAAIATVSLGSAGTGGVSINQTCVISNTGTAGYFRLSELNHSPYSDANGTAARIDGLCGIIEGSSDLLLPSLALDADDLLNVIGTFTIPA